MLMAPEGKRYSAYDKFIYAPYTDLSNHGGEVVLEMEATELIQNAEGTVVGVKGQTRYGGEYTVNAKAVILCAGGFDASSEMNRRRQRRQRQLPRRPERCSRTGAGGRSGR
mgnify:CR=1 FL=1